MGAENILSSWKAKKFKPVYWLEGEEEFFIDELMQYAEHGILLESERGFNQSVFYGKDANWADIVNACSRYPMFADKQVVLLKEAQQMRDVDKLEAYIANPLPSTILVISYKGKTLDARTKFSKVIGKKGEVFNSKKMYDNQVPAWANDFVLSKGFEIAPKALLLLVDHIGNDPGRIANEVQKVLMNINERSTITEDDIEQYVGISKDYNIYEFQQSIANRDLARAISIIQYFEANPKAAPLPLLLPTLYNFFSKVLTTYQMADKSERALSPVFLRNPSTTRQALSALTNYSYGAVEQVILLLHEYNLKSIGIRNGGMSNASLLKELAVKIIHYSV